MADRRFTLFHISLSEVVQPTFSTLRMSRPEWLYEVFGSGFTFPYRGGSDLFWVPRPREEEYIFGVVQRTLSRRHHEAPEFGGQETVSDEWQGSYVLIDPTDHDKGQRMAIENDIVGQPSSIAKHIKNYLNSREDRPFNVEIEQVFNKAGFWSFSEDRGHNLQYISFSLVAPNMWRTREGLEEDLRRARNETGAKKYGMRLGGADGVNTNNRFVGSAVDYSAQGGGSIRAKGFDGKVFDSRRDVVTTRLSAAGADEGVSEENIRLARKRVLGYEN